MSTELEPDVEADIEAEPQGAVLVGLWASGLRCLFQYVLAPALGAFGGWLPVAGLVVQVLGCVVTVAGARQLHRARRPGWPLWVALACVVAAATAFAVVSAGVAVLR